MNHCNARSVCDKFQISFYLRNVTTTDKKVINHQLLKLFNLGYVYVIIALTIPTSIERNILVFRQKSSAG